MDTITVPRSVVVYPDYLAFADVGAQHCILALALADQSGCPGWSVSISCIYPPRLQEASHRPAPWDLSDQAYDLVTEFDLRRETVGQLLPQRVILQRHAI